jgi:N-acetylmuramoyl-L-alanine amidase
LFYYGNKNSKFIVCGGSGHYLTTAGKRTPKIESLGGRIIREYEFNQPTKIKMFEGLKRCGIASFDANYDKYDTPLDVRAKRANTLIRKANDLKRVIYISLHYNSVDNDNKFENSSGGIEIYYYPGSSLGKKLAQKIYNQLKKGTEQKVRGIKTAKFAILRYTKMPAILSENGFMDVLQEALLMLSEEFQEEVAEEHVKGICQYFGIKYVEPNPIKDKFKLYRVQTGAFANIENAKKLIAELKTKGYNAILK